MSSLILPYDPTGIPPQVTEQMNGLMASLQAWAGKRDADGRWVTAPFDATDYVVGGAGNSWVVPATDYNRTSYYLVGNTMVLNIYISGSTLTVSPAPNNHVEIRIPDNYRVKGAVSGVTIIEGRVHAAAALVSVASGAYEACTMTASPIAPTQISFTRVAGMFADGTFAINAQLAIEVVQP